jgi:xanthine dehydrogenase/oxidase
MQLADLEPNAHIVVPGESGELVSYSSTQCPDKHQRYIASVLGLPAHKVVVRTKRLGGGFGGKETRAAAVNAAAALPAHLLQRPVRLVLDRDEDMATTGHRHPFLARYTVGFNAAGDLLALDVEFYSNAGCSLDLSGSIMDRALLHADCAYAFPALRARGWVCRTNLPSNTAFRGFGGPQGQLAAEAALDAVAAALGAAPEALRARNLYRAGADVAPCGQAVDAAVLRRCWDGALAAGGGLPARRAAAAVLNSSRRYLKRGLAAVPTKFGISFTTKFLNQAGALVHVYAADGTVLVTHGGVEMGQGLHTKVCQVVAAALGCALSDVHVAETATDKVRAFSCISFIGFGFIDIGGARCTFGCAYLHARLLRHPHPTLPTHHLPTPRRSPTPRRRPRPPPPTCTAPRRPTRARSSPSGSRPFAPRRGRARRSRRPRRRPTPRASTSPRTAFTPRPT